MHARTRHSLVHIEQVFTFAKGVDQNGRATTVITVRTQPHQVVQQARDFGKHHPDVLRPNRHFKTQKLFDGQAVRMLVGHHGHVIQSIHIRKRLNVGFVLGQLFSGAVQQSNVRIGALHNLAIELQHKAQYTVGCRVLRPQIQGIVLDFGHGSPQKTVRSQCSPPYLSSRMMRGVISRGSMLTGS